MDPAEEELARAQAERLRTIMGDLQLTAADLDRKTGYSAGYMSRLVRAERTMAESTAWRIARATGYRPQWILAGDGEPRPDAPDTPSDRDARRARLVHLRIAYHCPECGTEIRVGVRRCPSCGRDELLWPAWIEG